MATYPAGSEQMLTGKYFSSNQAVRIRVGLNHSSNSNSTNYDNLLILPTQSDQPFEVTDTVTESLQHYIWRRCGIRREKEDLRVLW